MGGESEKGGEEKRRRIHTYCYANNNTNNSRQKRATNVITWLRKPTTILCYYSVNNIALNKQPHAARSYCIHSCVNVDFSLTDCSDFTQTILVNEKSRHPSPSPFTSSLVLRLPPLTTLTLFALLSSLHHTDFVPLLSLIFFSLGFFPLPLPFSPLLTLTYYSSLLLLVTTRGVG